MAAANNLYASSPVVGILPSQQNQYFDSSHYAYPAVNAINSQTPGRLSNPFTPTGSIPPTPGSVAGRKRSRADITAPDDGEEEQFDDGAVATPLDAAQGKPRGKPVYGPGMTVIYPEDHGYQAAAESQSGTWVEEQAERKPFQLSHIKRPSVSSRKSQRRNAGACGPDDLAQLVLPPSIREATAEPLIDEATRVLGISWTRMDATEVLRISQAAYSKWIQNHYSGLKGVVIWFENSAIPGYLVRAQNAYTGQKGYYIFSNDLTEGRLVTTEPEQLVPRLKMLPALHLAAPGGHIRAESDPMPAMQNQPNGEQSSTANEPTQFSQEVSQLRGRIQDHLYPCGNSAEPQESNGICSAHEMDLD
ncbi:hypothetical protein LTR36_005731 [Oleoguttula mirabilis]|uniref:Uncharacterized protein n=1 Tax=Oleoguttula mirabilis TaxID=1507867 RepID=A0AAV9JDG7_9PEZI|nr:hypothetical protein LTR36_005731 [Oleoguttula mirabilis]